MNDDRREIRQPDNPLPEEERGRARYDFGLRRARKERRERVLRSRSGRNYEPPAS